MKFKNLVLVSVLLLILTSVSFFYDNPISEFMASIRNPVLTQAMEFTTDIGELYLGVPIVLFLVYGLEGKNKKIFWSLFIGLIIITGLSFVVKEVVQRPRPEGIAVLVEESSSFPSNHAGVAFAMFGIIYYYVRKYPLGFYSLAALIALSRVYLGAHYLSDVIFGALLGILVSQLVIDGKLGMITKKFIFIAESRVGSEVESIEERIVKGKRRA